MKFVLKLLLITNISKDMRKTLILYIGITCQTINMHKISVIYLGDGDEGYKISLLLKVKMRVIQGA